MQITKVEDILGSPGAVKATFEDGTSMTVPREKLPPQLQLQNSGATAQNMSVDPSVGASPAPMASVGPSNPEEFSSKWGAPPVAPQEVSDFAPQPIGQAPQQAPRPTMVQSGGDFVGGYQAPQAPLDPRQQEIARLRSPYKVVAGRAAFDPVKEAARRSPVPVSQTVQTASARAYDPEMLRDAQEKEQKALEMQAEGNMLQASAKLQADRLEASEVSNLYQQRLAEQQAREADFNSKQADLDDEAKAVAAREIDPNRVFKNMSIFQSLGLAIAAGLKGYATQGRDNSVMDSLMHRMDADIRAQEHDIQTSKGRVDNALSRLSQQFGSIQAGKAALKDQQLSVIMAKNTATASEIGTAVAKSNADAANQKLLAEQAKVREQRWSESQGQTSVATSAAMVSPKAATRGGLARKSDAESLKGWEAADKLESNQANTEGKQLENLKTRGEITGDLPGKEGGQLQEHLGKNLSEVAQLRSQVDNILSMSGITQDKVGHAQHGDIPGVGAGYKLLQLTPAGLVFGESLNQLAASYLSKDGARIRSQTMEVLTGKIKEASGAAFSEKEAARHAEALGQAYLAGEDQFAQAMVDFSNALEAKERSFRAGAGPAASRRYDEASNQIREDSAASKAGIKGTYRGTVTE